MRSIACSIGSRCSGARSASSASFASRSARECHTPSTRVRKYSRSAFGMSSASPNSCTRSCQGAALSCRRYSACRASLRATLRLPLYSRAFAELIARPSQFGYHGSHLDGAVHRLTALVHGARRGTLEGLVDGLDREHAEDDRHATVEVHLLQA